MTLSNALYLVFGVLFTSTMAAFLLGPLWAQRGYDSLRLFPVCNLVASVLTILLATILTDW